MMMNSKHLRKGFITIMLLVSLLCGTLPSHAVHAEEGADLQTPIITDPTIEVIIPTLEPDPSEVPTPVPTALPTAVPIPTEIPMESESPYDVAVLLPLGWTNAPKANVTISIVKRDGLDVQQLEIMMAGQWKNLTASFTASPNGEVELEITENTMLTVRVTDPHGHQFEVESDAQVFDRIAPKVTAGIVGQELQVQAQDEQSGVGGIQVNGLLFTTMQDGSLNVQIKDILSKYERLAVRAFDYAGNFSDPVTLDNPYYVAEPDPTAAPTATPKPTQIPSYESSPAIVTQFPAAIATSTPEVVYVYPDEPTVTATPIIQTEYITVGPGMPYLADGNAHTLDVLYSAATNKQFITMQSKSGNVFYLVIDYDKPIDEEAEMYETYFLNLVDERDLLALMDEDELPTATPEIIYVTPEPTHVPVSTPPVIDDTPEKDDNKQLTAIIALVAVLAIGGVVAFLFIKKKRNMANTKQVSDYGLDDEDEDDSDDTPNDSDN